MNGWGERKWIIEDWLMGEKMNKTVRFEGSRERVRGWNLRGKGRQFCTSKTKLSWKKVKIYLKNFFLLFIKLYTNT